MKASALISALAKYEQAGYNIDSLIADVRLDKSGVACGKSFIPPTKKCSKEKAKTTPKEALQRTTQKQKARQKLRAEVEKRPNRAIRWSDRAQAKNEVKPSALTSRKAMLNQINSWQRELEALGSDAKQAVDSLKLMEEVRAAIAKNDDLKKMIAGVKDEQRADLERMFKGRLSQQNARIASLKKKIFETLHPRKLVRMPKGSSQREFAIAVEKLSTGDKQAIKQYTVPRPKGYKTGDDRQWAKKQAAKKAKKK